MQFKDTEEENKNYDSIIQRFWGKITEMITGPEHEYIYLKGLIENLNG